MTGKKAVIRIHGVVDDSPVDFEYPGEYALDRDTHLIVYTDYTGNDITKCAIQANAHAMLLHRTGTFSGDMFFHPAYPTSVQYGADILASQMVLHTRAYDLTEEDHRITITMQYLLTDPHGGSAIEGRQQIEIIREGEEI